MNCHMCNSVTDFNCDSCGEPVCEDCCVVMTIHNQIDYPLCMDCEEMSEAVRYITACKEGKRNDKIKAEKERKNARRRAIYWKPENVEKRRLVKIEKKRLRTEQAREALIVVNDIFRGMF